MANPISEIVEQERRAKQNPIISVVQQERAASQTTKPTLLGQVARFLGNRIANSPAASLYRSASSVSDFVSRPDYAALNVLDYLTGGERHKSVGEAFSAGLSPQTQEDRGSWQHLLHRVPDQYARYIPFGVGPLLRTNTGEALAGFALDLIASPTSAIGEVAKALGVVPRVAKSINTWLLRSELGRNLLRNFSTQAHFTASVPVNTPAAQRAAIQAQTDTFNVAFKERAARQTARVTEEPGDASDVMNRLLYASRATQHNVARQYWDRLKEIAQDLQGLEAEGVDPEDVFRLAEQSKRLDLEQPTLELPGNVSTGIEPRTFQTEQVRPVVEKINRLNADILEAEKAAEAPIRGLNDVINYMTHLRTDEFDDLLRRMGITGLANQWSIRSRFQLPREIYGKDVAEANAWIAKNGIDVVINPETGATRKVFPKQAFKTNPLEVLAVRSMSSARVQAASQLFDDVARVFGRPAGSSKELIEQGWRSLEGVTEFGDKFQGLVFHPEVADQIEGTTRLLQKDELTEFLGFFDDLLSKWKVGMLAFNFPYHTHNILSNGLLAWKAGVRSPQPWVDAFSALRNGGVIKIGDQTLTSDELLRMAQEDGVIGTGRYSGEIDRTLQQLSAGRRPSDIAFNFQTFYEDLARLATYIDRLRKSPGEITRNKRLDAAMHTMRHLLNYADVSRGDQAIRRWIPFWIWPRKMVPLIAESIIEDPDFVSIPAKLKNAIEQGQSDAPDEQMRDPWLVESGAIRLGKVNGEGVYLDLSSSLPTSTFDEFARNFPVGAAEQIYFGARPELRLIGTLASGVEFGGREFEPERSDLLFGIPVPRGVQRVAELIPGVGNVTRIGRSVSRGDPWWAVLLANTGFPVYFSNEQQAAQRRQEDREQAAREAYYRERRSASPLERDYYRMIQEWIMGR